jgi:polar amino acid transport system substrate-binding protein
MKTICITALLSGMVVGMCGTALAGDTLENVKKKGVLVAGVSDSKPSFGYIDEKTHEFIGYDIDFARTIAGRLGVKLEFKSVTEESRIPELILGNIDIIAATLTNTSERAKLIDFIPTTTSNH